MSLPSFPGATAMNIDPERAIYSAGRFRDKVALLVADNGGSVYLDPAEARQLGRYLIDMADTVDSDRVASPPPLTIRAKDRTL